MNGNVFKEGTKGNPHVSSLFVLKNRVIHSLVVAWDDNGVVDCCYSPNDPVEKLEKPFEDELREKAGVRLPEHGGPFIVFGPDKNFIDKTSSDFELSKQVADACRNAINERNKDKIFKGDHQ